MAIIYNHITNNITADSGNVSINGAVPSAGGGSSSTKTIANKTAAYTVIAGDAGKIINCTGGTFTVTLTAAATVGAGFTCTIWNTSNTYTDVITIDPNSTETIDGGYSTIDLRRGEGLDIVCDGTNWHTDNKKPMRMYAENLSNTWARPTCSGNGALAIGESSSSSGLESYAFGYGANASGTEALAIGTRANAASNFSTAIGENSAQQGSKTVTGAGAMALGGSYASGTDSFAAAIANNTSSYGAKGGPSIAMGNLANASAYRSIAIGDATVGTGTYGVAIGLGATASAQSTVAIGSGYWGAVVASSNNSTAIGNTSGGYASQAVTGAGAMALGGSYASGQDSFAAAVVTNTSTYGATGFGSIALGRLTLSSGNHTIALGRGAISSGGLAISTDDGTGMFATSTKTYAVAIGGWAHATLIGQYSFASGGFGGYGDAQYSKMVLRAQTTTTTSVVLTSDAGAASAINQVVAKNGQCIAVKGTLIGHNYAGGLTNQAVVYDISCVLLSDGNSGGVSLHDSSVLTRLGTDGIGITTVPTLSVNTSYNALTITSGNKAATNIRWVATVHLTMVT